MYFNLSALSNIFRSFFSGASVGRFFRLLWNLRSLGTPQFLQWVGFFAWLHMKFSDSSMRMTHLTHMTYMTFHFMFNTGHGVPGTLSRFRLPRAVALDEMQQRWESLGISDSNWHSLTHITKRVYRRILQVVQSTLIVKVCRVGKMNMKFRCRFGVNRWRSSACNCSLESNETGRTLHLYSLTLEVPQCKIVDLLKIDDKLHFNQKELRSNQRSLWKLTVNSWHHDIPKSNWVELGRLYISDAANHAVRLLSLSDNNLTTVMGSLGANICQRLWLDRFWDLLIWQYFCVFETFETCT